MRHQKTGRKLGRDSSHRKALFANLVGAVIQHGRIETTLAKAKEVRPLTEEMITLGRKGDLHSRRLALGTLRSQDVVHKLFAEVAPRFVGRPGGYTRIIKLGPRKGDAAEMAYLVELDLSGNGLSAFPHALLQLQRLTRLSMARNHIQRAHTDGAGCTQHAQSLFMHTPNPSQNR